MIDPTLCDMTASELFQAYYDCRRTKRNTPNALAFEERLERNLMDLYHDLVSGRYRPGTSICFVVEHPKVREIWAADFRDRVVHHVLYNRVAGQFLRSFIHDSYACIPGKGTHKAVEKIERHVRSQTQNYTKPGYVLKMDVANFFASIDRHVLDAQLARRITHPWWVWLYRTILHHDPTQDVVIQGPKRLLRKVPAHKSLFNSKGRGLPIGNLSSQFFANVYLDDLDQYAKHRLRIKRWVRYVDDVVVIGECGKQLAALVDPVDAFLQDKLGLRLHPNKVSVNRVDHGFDAMGFIVRPHARYIRRLTVKNATRAVRELCEDKARPEKIAATADSYFGIFRQANAWRERERLAGLLREHGHLVSPKLNRMFRGKPA